jgi:hypothetical protein
MACKRVGEGLTRKDTRPDLGGGRPQSSDVNIGCEQLERVIDSGARFQQESEIEGKDGDIFRPGPLCELETKALSFSRVFRDNGINRNETEIVDTTGHFRSGRRRNQPAHDFTALGQGTIAEVRHCLTRWW